MSTERRREEVRREEYTHRTNEHGGERRRRIIKEDDSWKKVVLPDDGGSMSIVLSICMLIISCIIFIVTCLIFSSFVPKLKKGSQGPIGATGQTGNTGYFGSPGSTFQDFIEFRNTENENTIDLIDVAPRKTLYGTYYLPVTSVKLGLILSYDSSFDNVGSFTAINTNIQTELSLIPNTNTTEYFILSIGTIKPFNTPITLAQNTIYYITSLGLYTDSSSQIQAPLLTIYTEGTVVSSLM